MHIVIGIVVVALLLIFVVLPLVKSFFQALLAFLGNVLGVVIGIAILVGAIALCVMFPVLLIPAIIFVLYSVSKGKGGNAKTRS
ncbi:hypothetical protein [uncultured Photobacterium sp.]|uniref:hypothetical protein n=1 Tax=uncultured Photobacterium sp. TaxID=173973 RepID=UPI002617A06B|nr:hypothetical protein [uncultured Photobacterium sp.]